MKGDKAMDRKDIQKVMKILKEILPKLSENEQRYILGLAEGMELARVAIPIRESPKKDEKRSA